MYEFGFEPKKHGYLSCEGLDLSIDDLASSMHKVRG